MLLCTLLRPVAKCTYVSVLGNVLTRQADLRPRHSRTINYQLCSSEPLQLVLYLVMYLRR